MHVLIANAYSADNLGDGLLVEAAVGLVRDAHPSATMSIAAADPESFTRSGLDAFAPFPVRARPLIVLAALLVYVTGGRLGTSRRFRRECRAADLVVSVGGGYLRGPSISETLASICVHLAQMRAVAASGNSWIALPQSIGPFHPALWRLVRSVLAKADRVWVRDDRSLADLSSLANVRRSPDCALLDLPDQIPNRDSTGTAVGLIVRSLPRPRNYWDQMAEVLDGPFDFVPTLQSSVRGNNDEPAYDRLSLERPKVSLLSGGDEVPTVVLAVRLHGALMAVAQGRAVVHLSYERKGFSAFEDLGVDEFVFNARDFDPERVTKKLTQLCDDPSKFTARVAAAQGRMAAARVEVVRSLRL